MSNVIAITRKRLFRLLFRTEHEQMETLKWLNDYLNTTVKQWEDRYESHAR